MAGEKMFEIVPQEFVLVQQQIDKFDDVGYKIKTWAVTLWVALFGWALQFDNPRRLLLVGAAILIFYRLDAVNKDFRQDYRKRRNQIIAALRQYGRVGTWPEGFQAPEGVAHRPAGIVRQLPNLICCCFMCRWQPSP